MKKVFTSAVIIISFVLYSIMHNRTMTDAAQTANEPTEETLSVTPAPTTNAAAVAGISATAQPQSKLITPPTNAYKDGQYTGSSADAYYGYIQVRATIQNGKISDIAFLQYPNDHRESIQINSRALPMLKQEAIQAQNAKVNIVSRATDSSLAFMESLASALAKAKS